MKCSPLKAFAWLLLYFALALIPVAASYFGPLPDPRAFATEFGVALGFLGLTVLILQFVTTGRLRNFASTLGFDSMLQFHRQLGVLALFLVLAHPIVLFFADPQNLEFLDPRINFPRALALSAVLFATPTLILTSLWREAFKLPYEWWRALHGVLAALVVFVGLVHIVQVGHYVSVLWKQVMWVLLTLTALLLIVKSRVLKPWRMKRKPWKVSELRKEVEEVYTLVFEPVGHPGMEFLTGQFIWVTLGDSPYSLQQHPFTISSSATKPDRIEVTVKKLGDFSSTIKEVQLGSKAFLEGPYGYFTPSADPRQDAVFIVGGVGVTPAMSMLRSFRDRKDSRAILMIYGNSAWEDVIFREELEEIERELNLTLVHAIEDPPDDWEGEKGRISEELIERYLPKEIPETTEFFICGPEPLMDLAERYLKTRNVSRRKLYSERFDIV